MSAAAILCILDVMNRNNFCCTKHLYLTIHFWQNQRGKQDLKFFANIFYINPTSRTLSNVSQDSIKFLRLINKIGKANFHQLSFVIIAVLQINVVSSEIPKILFPSHCKTYSEIIEINCLEDARSQTTRWMRTCQRLIQFK